MSWSPAVTVAAVVERHGRFLMVREIIHGKQVINQPAGHLEANESLMDAVIREMLEETAYHFIPEALIGLYRYLEPITGTTFLRVTFSGAAQGPLPGAKLSPEIQDVIWLSPEELEAQEAELRSPLVLRCIRDHLAGAHHPLAMLADLTPDESPEQS
ncbi:MAG: NUDIX hydrolase [Gammaproteobacteria bacterium]|nr:MAG: NUDIX hydrolase [Gammaproteobacteria bacterium]